jgi:acetate kinase
MGFTPLAGVMMGSRSGDIDPAIVGFLSQKAGKTASEIIDMLNTKSGLYGVSKVNSDFRDVGMEYLAGNKDAELALYMFAYHVKKYIGAYLVALNGADAIIFTGGVGERNPSSRRRILEDLDGIGIKFDLEKNKIRGQQIEVTAPGSNIRILVVPTNEELMIARDTKTITEELV